MSGPLISFADDEDNVFPIVDMFNAPVKVTDENLTLPDGKFVVYHAYCSVQSKGLHVAYADCRPIPKLVAKSLRFFKDEHTKMYCTNIVWSEIRFLKACETKLQMTIFQTNLENVHIQFGDIENITTILTQIYESPGFRRFMPSVDNDLVKTSFDLLQKKIPLYLANKSLPTSVVVPMIVEDFNKNFKRNIQFMREIIRWKSSDQDDVQSVLQAFAIFSRKYQEMKRLKTKNRFLDTVQVPQL